MKNALCHDAKVVARGLQEIQRKSKYSLLFSCLFATFQAAQPFVSIYFSAQIIDGIIEKVPSQELINSVIWLVGMNCICTILMKWMEVVTFSKNRKLGHAIQMGIAAKLHRIDYVLLEDSDVQSKKEKIENMAQNLGLGVTGVAVTIPFLLQHSFSILISVALTFKLFFSFKTGYSGWQAWVCSPIFSVGLMIIIGASVFINMKSTATSRSKEYEIAKDFEKIIARLNFYYFKYIGNYHFGKDIRIYNQNGLLMDEITKEKDKVHKWYFRLNDNRLKFRNLSSTVSVCISGLVYLFVGIKAFVGLITVGSVVQYVGSISQFVSGLTNLMSQLTDLKACNEALECYFEFMDIPEVKMAEGLPIKDEPKEIEFHNVSFKYPGSETYVLRNLSVKFQMDKKIAIVGMNGSGKTTLIKLICRLYQPTEGKITLNGVDIGEYKLADYFEKIAVVFQDFKLFGFTLGENVAASADVDKERVEEALTKAGFGERYQTLEDGIQTYLSKDYEASGIDLSGGEEQKIAISRALYKDAPIVILDEPTAALDPISEYEIYSRFNQMVQNKMAIFISHRLSSCRFCDEIIVMDSGEMVQHGNHDMLVKNLEGKYYELWNAQAQYYNEG